MSRGLTELQAEVLDLLRVRSWTPSDLAAEVGVSCNNISHLVARLVADGHPVAREKADLIGPGQDTVYSVRWPKGRVCAHEGCGTILRRTNPAQYCERHGGGFITDDMMRPEPKRRKTVKACPRCGEVTDNYCKQSAMCRPCYNAYRREYDRERKKNLQGVSA